MSITLRSVIGLSVVLAIFIALVGLSISYSVHQRAETARFDRLQGLIYGILGATNIQDDATLLVNEYALPDSRLTQATSGIYAELVGSDGTRLWQSNSLTSWLPPTQIRPIGDWFFQQSSNDRGETLDHLQFSTAWEFENGEELPFIVHVANDADSLGRQLNQFDRTLWLTLLGSALALLWVQLIVMRKSLQPLTKISDEVREIEHGDRQSLTHSVPKELQPITFGLNTLISSERERQMQYRHLLDDLAHSLKTPMSILRNLDDQNKSAIAEQTALMQQSIDRHLQRAATTSASAYLAPSIPVVPVIERIVLSLRKIYCDPAIAVDIQINDDFLVRMEEADLFEVVGNVLENACKYGASSITVSSDNTKRLVQVNDNGRGFPDIDLNILTQRGVRADSQVEGTGVGLSAASQLMAHYGGKLMCKHGQHQGACVELTFAS